MQDGFADPITARGRVSGTAIGGRAALGDAGGDHPVIAGQTHRDHTAALAHAESNPEFDLRAPA